MKKLLVAMVCILLLAACSNTTADTTYKADEKHLENIVLEGVDQKADTITFKDGSVTVVVDDVANSIKPNVNVEELKNKQQSENTYKITKIETKDDSYLIVGEDNFVLQLKRIGERIFEDEKGVKYQTSTNLN